MKISNIFQFRIFITLTLIKERNQHNTLLLSKCFSIASKCFCISHTLQKFNLLKRSLVYHCERRQWTIRKYLENHDSDENNTVFTRYLSPSTFYAYSSRNTFMLRWMYIFLKYIGVVSFLDSFRWFWFI